MWRTPEGMRTLRGSEAALLRAAVESVAEELQDEADELMEAGPYDVQLFDELPWQQKLALLERVATALLVETSPPPELNAVNEATVAALVVVIERNIEIELDYAKEELPPEYDKHRWRRMLAACQNMAEVAPEDVVDETCDYMSEWTLLVECFSDGILWDGDWDMPDLFMDAEPELSGERRRLMGILPDYYVEPAPDVRDGDVQLLFESVRRLSDGQTSQSG